MDFDPLPDINGAFDRGDYAYLPHLLPLGGNACVQNHGAAHSATRLRLCLARLLVLLIDTQVLLSLLFLRHFIAARIIGLLALLVRSFGRVYLHQNVAVVLLCIFNLALHLSGGHFLLALLPRFHFAGLDELVAPALAFGALEAARLVLLLVALAVVGAAEDAGAEPALERLPPAGAGAAVLHVAPQALQAVEVLVAALTDPPGALSFGGGGAVGDHAAVVGVADLHLLYYYMLIADRRGHHLLQ